jgi:PAS domain S-box-containing protein
MHPLFATEDMLRALGQGIVATDTLGRVAFVAPELAERFGLDAERWLGQPAGLVFPVLWEAIRPCLERGVAQPSRLAASRGKLLNIAAAPIYKKGKLAGAVALIEEAPVNTVSPQAANQVMGLFARQEQRFQAVFNSVSDGLWICDGQGVILAINSASEKLNSVRAADYVGKTIDCILAEGLVDRSVTIDVLRDKRQASLIQHVKRTGKQLLVTGAPAFDEDGNVFLVVVNERDVTELNALRERLQTARKVEEKYRSELAELSMLELNQVDLVAESGRMRQVVNTLLKLAHMDASHILILGESGTGKGLLAKLLHKRSPRAAKPFIQINCPALPENLFEAELFGYEKGAFTGAREQGKAGLIELARGGTLFLDEIGDIPLTVQAKLLKYLDDHELMRLGGNVSHKVDCCVVAATNINLERRMASKQFRKDLFYRLNAFTVRIPPLRERQEDIFPLAKFYLTQCNAKFNTEKRLTPRAMRLLESHDYPGNVRELIGIIQKGCVISESDDLTEALEEALGETQGGVESGSSRTRRTLPDDVDEAGERALRKALGACRTTREMAAYLGVSQSTVVRKLRKYGLRVK